MFIKGKGIERRVGIIGGDEATKRAVVLTAADAAAIITVHDEASSVPPLVAVPGR